VADNDEGTIDGWQLAMLAAPVAAFVLPPLAIWLLGGFDDFQWIDQPVTFLQSFGTLGAMCFPFGTFLYVRRKWNQTRARLSRTWPTVPGKVQSSKIERRITGLPAVLWRLALSYDYSVSGMGYQGDAVQFGPKYISSRELIDAFAIRYPAGADVTVRYDPDDPATSVLETCDEMAQQNSWQIWILFLAPVVISIVAAIKNS
jgi:uncharacterized membrane protein YqaE (UPF0057 family)